MRHSSWTLQIKKLGRGGPLTYTEGDNHVEFDFELGSGEVGGTIYCDSASVWDARHPWAAGRRREILERVAGEFVRREFRNYTFELGGTMLRPRIGADNGLTGFDPVRSDDVIVIRKGVR